MAYTIRTGAQPCSTQLVRAGDYTWEGNGEGGLAGFWIYGDGQRVGISVDDARGLLNLLDSCLRLHDKGDKGFNSQSRLQSR